ncbi:MAG: choice-of-anchor Q domain-containing protein [Methylovulum sp.]|nr:choice-of-anchor Q domain-containing protein [Methylovulum sp.]
MTFNRLPFSHSTLALAIVVACSSGTASSATLNIRGGCTLINAINNANTDTDTDGPIGCPAGSGVDTINLVRNKTYTLTTVDNNTDGNNGLPVLSSEITINGNDSVVSRTGQSYFRIFHIAETGKVLLKSITIQNGRLYTPPSDKVLDEGGGVLNKGSTTMVNSVVSANITGGNGGGIANLGKLNIINTTIAGNGVDGWIKFYDPTHFKGGGIFNSGDLTLTYSTISGNSARGFFDLGYYIQIETGYSGGIHNIGRATITNSTISGNFSKFVGGINNDGTLTLTNSTISDNASVYPGISGNIINYGTMNLTNTIIANNQSESGGDCINNSGTILKLKGINLIEDGSCNAQISGDPNLGSLLDNGGHSLTHALLESSSAIDTASCSSYHEQRLLPRPQPEGNRCDIGAYERIPIKPTTISTSVLAIVNFFRRQTASGGIVGVGVNPLADQKQTAVLNQLIATGAYRDQSQNSSACSQLKRLLPRIDTDMTPDEDDYVTGNEAARLASKVSALRRTWTCPQ